MGELVGVEAVTGGAVTFDDVADRFRTLVAGDLLTVVRGNGGRVPVRTEPTSVEGS